MNAPDIKNAQAFAEHVLDHITRVGDTIEPIDPKKRMQVQDGLNALQSQLHHASHSLLSAALDKYSAILPLRLDSPSGGLDTMKAAAKLLENASRKCGMDMLIYPEFSISGHHDIVLAFTSREAAIEFKENGIRKLKTALLGETFQETSPKSKSGNFLSDILARFEFGGPHPGGGPARRG